MKIINLDGIVGWDILASDINREIDECDGDIIFDMNSGGGYITEGVSILNKIRNYSKGKTIARVSYSASMMTQIALACDEVQVYDNAIFMIHNAQGFASGDHHEMVARAVHLKAMTSMLAKIYVKKTGKKQEDIEAMMDETTYMFGEDIVTEGFADLLIDTEGEKDLALATESGSVNFKKAMDAMKEEGLSASELGKELKLCTDNCNLATMPSSEKIANSTKGISVKKTNAELQALLDTANTTIEANQSSIDGRDADIVALNESIATLNVTINEFDANKATAITDAVTSAEEARETNLKGEFKGIMAMAIELGAPKDVALSMVECSTLDEATIVCNKAMVSAGVTFGGENNHNEPSGDTNHGWDNIMKKGRK